VKDVNALLLVIADDECAAAGHRIAKFQRQTRAFGIAGEILGRVTDCDQRLLHQTAKSRLDAETFLDAVNEVIFEFFLASQLFA